MGEEGERRKSRNATVNSTARMKIWECMVSSVCANRIGDLLREVEDGPIKCPRVPNDWSVLIEQLKPHVFALNNRSEGEGGGRGRERGGGEGGKEERKGGEEGEEEGENRQIEKWSEQM